MWTVIFTGLILLFILSMLFLAKVINQMVSQPDDQEKEPQQR